MSNKRSMLDFPRNESGLVGTFIGTAFDAMYALYKDKDELLAIGVDARAALAEAAATAALATEAAESAAAARDEAVNLPRTLRVAQSEPEIAPMPPIAERHNKLLSFDAEGNPIVVFPDADSAIQLSMDLADPDIGARLIASGGLVVPTVAAARALGANALSSAVFVLGYHAAGDGGGGPYRFGPAGVDNNGTVLSTSDGRTLHMLPSAYALGLDVRVFGAKADDADGTGSDSAPAINAARAFAVSAGIGKLWIIGKYRLVSSPVIVDPGSYVQSLILAGDGASTSRLRQTGTNVDVVWFSQSVFLRNCGIEDIEILSIPTAGHGVNIKYGCTLCTFTNVNVTALNPTKGCYVGYWGGLAIGDGGCFDCIWEGGDLYTTGAHTQYGIDFVTNGTCFNSNTFRRMRWNANNMPIPFARFVNIHNESYLVGNQFFGINAEKCKAGTIVGMTTRGWTFDGIDFWDVEGDYTNHCIQLLAGGLGNIGAAFRNLQRNGDTVAGDVHEVHFESGAVRDASFTSCSLTSVDFGNAKVHWEGPLPTTMVNARYVCPSDPDHNVTAFATITGVNGSAIKSDRLVCTRTGVGAYRFDFVYPRPDTSYSVDVRLAHTTSMFAPSVVQSGASFTVTCIRFDQVAVDPLQLSVSVYG